MLKDTNEERFNLIEAYLTGQMGASQRSRFVQRLALDPLLRREVKEYRLLIRDLERMHKEKSRRNLLHRRKETGGAFFSMDDSPKNKDLFSEEAPGDQIKFSKGTSFSKPESFRERLLREERRIVEDFYKRMDGKGNDAAEDD